LLPEWFRGEEGQWYFIHVDLGTGGVQGSGKDACGLCVGHKGPDVIRDNTSYPTVVIDLAVRFKASGKRKVIRQEIGGKMTSARVSEQIRLEAVRELIFKLDQKRGFRIAKVTLDGFQSLDMIQILQSKGYLADRASCNRQSWDTMRGLWYDSRVDIFSDQWLMYEMARLQEKKGKIDHAIGCSNDEAECVARVCEMVLEGDLPEIKKKRAMPTMTTGLGSIRGQMSTPGLNRILANRGLGGGGYSPFFK